MACKIFKGYLIARRVEGLKLDSIYLYAVLLCGVFADWSSILVELSDLVLLELDSICFAASILPIFSQFNIIVLVNLAVLMTGSISCTI